MTERENGMNEWERISKKLLINKGKNERDWDRTRDLKSTIEGIAKVIGKAFDIVANNYYSFYINWTYSS